VSKFDWCKLFINIKKSQGRWVKEKDKKERVAK